MKPEHIQEQSTFRRGVILRKGATGYLIRWQDGEESWRRPADVVRLGAW